MNLSLLKYEFIKPKLSVLVDRKTILFFGLLLLISYQSLAQISITSSNATITPESIVETFFLGEGVEVTNITYTGDNQAVGFFTDALPDVGIDRGMVMGSGNVSEAVGAYADFASTDTNGPNSDPDLEGISNVDINDVSKFEITFIPTADTLRFKYVFSSEEYPQFNCSPFNDVFGFFISGPNPAGGDYISENIALVPEPSDPSGTTFTNLPVSIANVHGMTGPNCLGSFEQYYNDNTGAVNFAYGAYLDVFIAQAIVIPCEEYTIKLAIADGQDQIYDSAVFLEAKSFGTGSLNVNIETVSLDGSIAEGCNSGKIILSLPSVVEEDYIVDATLIDCGNSATKDVDYFGVPDPIIIPAGSSSVEFEIFAVDEGVTEGEEFICFEVQRDVCNLDTVSIRISESPLNFNDVEIPNDTVICQKEIVNLMTSLPPEFILPEAPAFSSTFNTIVTNELEPNNFPINVTGVVPDYLAQGVIKSVCIDTIEHKFLNDIDLYLLTPGGQFLELSTDNGKKPFNDGEDAYMINTCFTPFGVVEIENGSSLSGPIITDNPTYTGDFQPEGFWGDLYGPDFPSNGVYELVYIDDETGAFGRITGWSICFNPTYFLTYEWSSDVDGEICTNCNDFEIEVEQNSTYYLEVTDSYGCTYVDSFSVTVNDLLPGVSNLSCDSVSRDYISFIWDAEPTADSYEIYIPGIIDPAIDIGLLTSWAVSGLESLTDYPIFIRTIGGICGGETATITCSTINCDVDDLVVESFDTISCFGLSDGLMDFDITGTFPPFSYEFRGIQSATGSFTNVSAGIDTLFITDNSGCISKYEINVPQPNILNNDIADIDPISCNNEIDGEARAIGFGGTAPYSYEWSSGELTDQAIMLAEGWNKVTITDANNCQKIDSLFFDNPPALQIQNNLVQDVICAGDSSGIAIVNPVGGTAPYQYLWGDVLNQKTKQANSLFAGTYNVTITDDAGCTIIEPVIVNSNDSIITSISATDTKCFNTSDGTAFVDVVGGSGNISFSWDNGETTNPAVLLSPGKHFVVVSDEDDCSVIDSVIINSPAEIEIDILATDPLCFNSADGSISWTFNGGTGVINSFDENFDPINSPLTNLVSGTYFINGVDDENCILDTFVVLENPIEISISFDTTGESCFNSNDAAIDIMVENGTEPYSFEWSGPGLFESFNEDINNVNSGKYFITVTDVLGCEKVDSIELIEPEEIVIQADVFNIACKNESEGIIQITVTGGVEPFSFSWLGPNGFTSDEEDLIDVIAGSYTLIFEDAAGCTVNKQYEIIEPAQGVTSGISGDDEVCFGVNNGIASVQPFGGTLPYDITWSNDSKFTNINGLSPGYYYVTIVDGSNCSIVDSVEIIERPEIELSLSQESSLCFESFDGSAKVDEIIQNGVVMNPDDFEYLWNSFPLQQTQEAINLQGGADYLVVVTDNLGCTANQTIVISTPEPVTAELDMIDSINCALGDDGSIVVEGRGGVGSYSYQWGQKANFQDGPAAKNLKAGSYTVTITDDNNCTGVEVFEIQDPFPITLNYRVFDVLCFGEESGEVELIANGGTEPYDYIWSNGDNDDEINELTEGFYKITVTDSKNCQLVDSVFVSQPESPLDFDVSIKNISCADGQDGAIIIDATGGVGNYIYSLDNFIYNGSVEQIGLAEGTYTAYIKDANGCIDSIESIDVFSPAPLELDLGEDEYLTYGQVYQFDPVISNFQPPLTLDWDSPDIDLLSCDDCLNPFFDAIKQATYNLVVTDANGCLVEDFINLYITRENAVFVPTGFTPNNDFNNDILSVYGFEGIEVVSFQVYDRWGERMFLSEDFMVNEESIGWDGTFRGKEMPPGVYTWVVEARLAEGVIEVYSGNSTLIK